MVVALIAFTARLAAADPNADEVFGEDSAMTGAADAASFDQGWSDVGSADDREPERHGRAPVDRVDLTITWRRTVRVADMRGALADPSGGQHGIASALDPATTARGVLWVMLTWSR